MTILTPAVFHILLALSSGPLHGYEIMKRVKSDTKDKVTMGPGTLYGSVKRMTGAKLIEEVSDMRTSRRRYYQITTKGTTTLNAELNRLNEALTVAGTKYKLI